MQFRNSYEFGIIFHKVLFSLNFSKSIRTRLKPIFETMIQMFLYNLISIKILRNDYEKESYSIPEKVCSDNSSSIYYVYHSSIHSDKKNYIESLMFYVYISQKR